ncbi:MAG: alpha/beta hydrolase-fold protein [Terracidiphilus sp.]
MKMLEFGLVLCLPLSAVGQSFSVSFPKDVSAQALDGRVLLVLSTDRSDEPRNQVDDSPRTQMVFGVTVDGLRPGEATVVDAGAWGYPVRSLKDVPAGEYYVQAVLNKYTTFHRSDGKTVKLHADQGEGQHWNSSPGNLYSKVQKVTLKAGGAPIAVTLTEVIPPIPVAADTKYVRHIRIQSEALTKFWGQPMYIGAIVLVPEGFDEHPNARFPVMIFHDHFATDIGDFRAMPPDPNLKPNFNERFQIAGYNRIEQEEEYKFYQKWISPGFPRYLVVKIQHANPFYDDSYAVNSANVGPYGDAIENELIPAIEKQFHAIGQGWARFTYGGSTGGWEALAVQLLYPDHYNGVFAACPDPVDFHAYTTINLYDDKNAYFLEGAHMRVPQPAMRDYLGHTLMTTEENGAYELALGDHGRSGDQFDIWQAVFGPVGADGYPAQIFDKVTGEIDHSVAEYWRQHYDLEALLERDWAKLGPELKGKIHIYVGSDDTYFLNDAVYRMEDFLKSAKDPAYGGEVTYGPRAEHCWNGDPTLSNAYSRFHYETQYLPKILEQIEKTAPAGADLTSWKY